MALLVLAAVAACASKEERSLERYVQSVTDARVHEARFSAVRARVTAWLERPDAASPPMDLVRQELLPAQQEYLRELEKIAPEDPALVEIHDRLLQAERVRLNGAFEVDAALQPDDDGAAFRAKFAMMVVNEAKATALRVAWIEALQARCRTLEVACGELTERASPR
jgi:hypothetical protein